MLLRPFLESRLAFKTQVWSIYLQTASKSKARLRAGHPAPCAHPMAMKLPSFRQLHMDSFLDSAWLNLIELDRRPSMSDRYPQVYPD